MVPIVFYDNTQNHNRELNRFNDLNSIVYVKGGKAHYIFKV